MRKAFLAFSCMLFLILTIALFTVDANATAVINSATGGNEVFATCDSSPGSWMSNTEFIAINTVNDQFTNLVVSNKDQSQNAENKLTNTAIAEIMGLSINRFICSANTMIDGAETFTSGKQAEVATVMKKPMQSSSIQNIIAGTVDCKDSKDGIITREENTEFADMIDICMLVDNTNLMNTSKITKCSVVSFGTFEA